MFGLGTKFIPIIVALLLVMGTGSFVLFRSFEPSPKTLVSESMPEPAPTTTDSIQETVSTETSEEPMTAPEEDEAPTSPPSPLPEPVEDTDEGSEPEPKQSSCTSDPNPVFTADITDLTKISKITPPGSVNPGDGFVTAHSYIWIEGSEAVPVYAPVDMTLGVGGFYTESGNPAQYILFFGVSCEVSIKIDHLDNPIEQIKDVLPRTPKIDSSTTDDVSSIIKFKAGDLLGYTGGTVQAHNWDFGVYNTTKPNFLSGDEQYRGDDRADCPYDYFAEDKKAIYYNLFVDRTGYGSPPTSFCKGDYTQPQVIDSPYTTIKQLTIAEPQVWVPDSMTQPVPPGASKTRLTSLPAPIDKIILTKIGAFGSHQGAHIEGLDHEWINIEDGTPIGSWGDGEVARVYGGKADDPTSVWRVVINFGDGLWGEYMEIKTPLVKVGDQVKGGQPIGFGVPAYTSPGYHSAEFILADEHRRDGVQAWIVDKGSAVSPFDYLQEDIQQSLIDEFTKQVIEPYIAKGQSIETVAPWEPYLTNPMLLHKDHKGTLVGEWLLTSKAWEGEGIYEMLTFLPPTKYYPHQRAVAIDMDQNNRFVNYFSGFSEIDYTTKRLVIETDIETLYGIFDLDESGPRATLKLEYQTGSYPETFGESSNIYTERAAIGAREDGYNLGARSSPY